MFGEEVERRVCEYAIPVSDACNARLQPPPPHVMRLLGTAAQHQAIADPLVWRGISSSRIGTGRIISNPERTTAMLDQFEAGGPAASAPYVMEMRGGIRTSRRRGKGNRQKTSKVKRAKVRIRVWMPALALMALTAVLEIDAQQVGAERTAAVTVLDVGPPSDCVRGAARRDGDPAAAVPVLPSGETRRRIVDVAVQEWAFFGFRLVDRRKSTRGRRCARRRATGCVAGLRRGRRRSRLSPGRPPSRGLDRRVLGGHARRVLDRRPAERRVEGTGRHGRAMERALVGGVHLVGDVRGRPRDDDQFQRAIAHHAYIDQAIRARDGRAPQAAFAAHDTGETAITPGDLLCSSRRPVYRTIAERRRQTGVGARTHCDVVVKVDEASERILAIGGNVRGVVSLKLLRAQREAGKPLRVVDPDEDSRPDLRPSEAARRSHRGERAGHQCDDEGVWLRRRDPHACLPAFGRRSGCRPDRSPLLRPN